MTVPRRRDSMTHGSQIQPDAPGPTWPLMHPKHTLKVGNWNARTLYRSGNSAQVAREMKRKVSTSWASVKRTGQAKEKCNLKNETP